jgi:hypothetical protein
MKISNSASLPTTIMYGFVGLLLATVAALVVWPFCRPLLWFLFSQMALFFLFALVVISFSFLLLIQSVMRSLSAGTVALRSKKPGRSVPGSRVRTAGQTYDLWDRWLDGV